MSKIISDWEGLSKLKPNDKYKIEIDLGWNNGYIISLEDEDDDFYLPTHIFYFEGKSDLLKDFGWDIELQGWD